MYGQDDFQLIEAKTDDVKVEMSWRRDGQTMNPHAVFSIADQTREQSNSEYVTAIIGKNGTGKSHLLTSIVQTFIAIEKFKSGSRRLLSSLPLSYLSYRLNGRLCIVERLDPKRYRFAVDSQDVAIHFFPLPQRVIALTISPFDKFPVPRSLRNSVSPIAPSLYHYLGLRDQFNKASMESLLFRSLNNLFEEGSNEALRRINIGAIFSYLELQPTLTVIYRLRIPFSIRRLIGEGIQIDFSKVITEYPQQKRIAEVIEAGTSQDELNHLLRYAIERTSQGVVRASANFSGGGMLDETFHTLQPLRRAGFLTLSGVEITQRNGLVSDLRRASSGQLSIVASLLSLSSVIVNGSLVLIDEPELSLHPEWQIDYVNLLTRTFSRFKGCHFVIATHSPMVISELPNNAQVIALDREDLPPVEKMTGQSADYLLAEVFGAPMHGNLYIRERVVTAMRLIASGQAKSVEFAAILSDLRKISVDMEEDDPILGTIRRLEDIAREAGTEVR
jgi:predicted ATPase